MYPKQVIASPISAYENTVEVATLEQLMDIISDPDAMRMQALLVRERILGPAHPDTSYYIRYRGAVYADMGHFERCITLWMYALDMQQKMLEPLCPMTQSSLLSFAELFSFMMSENRTRSNAGNDRSPVNFCDIMTVFNKAVEEVRMGQLNVRKNPLNSISGDRDITYLNRTLIIILHLICLLTKLMPHLNDDQVHQVKESVYHFLKLNPRGRNGNTPLHLACARDSSSVGRYPICQFPSLDAVQLLLECGADPNAKDNDSNTSLHVAAQNKPAKPLLVQTLLDAGVHLDAVNSEGKTFESLLKGQSIHEVINPMRFTKLQCLAAQVIKREGINYSEALFPQLERFVDMHWPPCPCPAIHSTKPTPMTNGSHFKPLQTGASEGIIPKSTR